MFKFFFIVYFLRLMPTSLLCCLIKITKVTLINPFVPNAPFLYPRKTEKLTVFWSFQGVAKGCIGSSWVKIAFQICPNCSSSHCQKTKQYQEMSTNIYYQQICIMSKILHWSHEFSFNYLRCADFRMCTLFHFIGSLYSSSIP